MLSQVATYHLIVYDILRKQKMPPPASLLSKRVRARRDESSDEDESHTLSDASSESNAGHSDKDEEDEDSQLGSEDDDDDDDEDNSSDEDEEDNSADEDINSTLKNISFGALAKAQASLGPKHKKRKHSTSQPDDEEAASESDPDSKSSSTKKRRTAVDDIRAAIRGKREERDETTKDTTTSSSNPRGWKELVHRSSKHAPQVLTSKRPTTRRRIVVEAPPEPKARDPRFDSVVAASASRAARGPVDVAAQAEAAAQHNYAFLNEYRASEMTELRKKIKGTKDVDEKAQLKRTVMVMADRQRAFDRKEKEKEVLAKHKRKEREMLRDGKKSAPYFLKKGDVKREVLKERWEGMKEGEKKRVVERRRKKVAGKERKEMPDERRAG